MPFPTPRLVISSPIRISSTVPAVSGDHHQQHVSRIEALEHGRSRPVSGSR